MPSKTCSKKYMTGKERLKKAFANTGEPDRVPFMPGLDNVDLISLSGLDYWEYERQGCTMLGDMIRWCDELGFDLCHYAAGIPEANPPSSVNIDVSKSEEADVRTVTTTVTTPRGNIWQRRRRPRSSLAYTHDKFIKNIYEDWPAFREYFGEDWTIDERYFDEYSRVGERGVVGMVIHTPIDFWQEYRQDAPQQVIFDYFDEERIMTEFTQWYRAHSLAYLMRVAELDPQPDFVLIHGSNCSASLISPDIFKAHALPYIQEISAYLKTAGITGMLHVCGRSNQWLAMIADTDIDVMDALERPPAGNVDLAEAKRLYGDRLCLKGNVSAITMANGKPEEVRHEVRRCIDAAARGGGYVLDVGDSIGPKVQLANLEAFVETAMEYGKY